MQQYFPRSDFLMVLVAFYEVGFRGERPEGVSPWRGQIRER